jgi:hypothetical protein
MESRVFIKTATALVQRIKDHALLAATVKEDREEGEAIQKALNTAFSGLQNPTLPSAYKLRDVALDNGFYVNPLVQHRLQQAESCWIIQHNWA